MSLSNAQQESIQAVIDVIINFEMPALPFTDSLKNLISTLLDALNTPLSETDDFYRLYECFHTPEHYFQGLVNLGTTAITTAEIQDYILTYIDSRLETTTRASKTSLKACGWEIENIKANMMSEENKSKIFKSEKAREENEESLAWMPRADAKKIFSYEMFQQYPEKNNKIDYSVDPKHFVKVVVQCPTLDGKIDRFEKIIAVKPLLRTVILGDDAQDHYLQEIALLSEKSATTFAADTATLQLEIDRNIREQHVLFTHAGLRDIIIYTYYFNLIKNTDAAFILLLKDKKLDKKILTDPLVIDWLEKKYLSFEDVLKLTPFTKAVLSISTYFALFSNKIEALSFLSEWQCKLLIRPSLAEKIKQQPHFIFVFYQLTDDTLRILYEHPPLLLVFINEKIMPSQLNVCGQQITFYQQELRDTAQAILDLSWHADSFAEVWAKMVVIGKEYSLAKNNLEQQMYQIILETIDKKINTVKKKVGINDIYLTGLYDQLQKTIHTNQSAIIDWKEKFNQLCTMMKLKYEEHKEKSYTLKRSREDIKLFSKKNNDESFNDLYMAVLKFLPTRKQLQWQQSQKRRSCNV